MKKRLSARDLSQIGIFAAVTAVLSQIAIPLPFTPVPLSLGAVAVYMTGMLLQPRCALFAQLSYLAIGAVGFPVFAGFQGGISRLVGPTGGYLMAYPLMAAAISLAVSRIDFAPMGGMREKLMRYVQTTASLAGGTLLLYLCGTAWLSAVNGISFAQGLALAVYPFVPLDSIKIVFCVASILPVKNRLDQMREAIRP